MYPLHLSIRFLRHHWLMSLIGSFFVGASLVILVVVMSVMDGFQARLRETVSGASADFIVTPRYPADLERLAEALSKHVPVSATAPFESTLTFVQRTHPDPLDDKLIYAQVFGIDGWREQGINKFGEFLSDRRSKALTVADIRDPFRLTDEMDRASGVHGVILGHGLAQELRVQVGEKVRIAAMRRKRPGAAGGSEALDDYDQDWLAYRIVGIYESGNGEKDGHCLFLDWKVVQELWTPDLRKSSVRCRLKPGVAYRDAIAALRLRFRAVVDESSAGVLAPDDPSRALLPDSWEGENRTLVRAIESEKAMILVISFLIVVAGTSSIFAAQWLLVSDKIREIGILRALGAGVPGVMTIFVLNGLMMGILGATGGALGGLLVVRRIDDLHDAIRTVTGREVFDKSIYLFDRIPTQVDYGAVTAYAVAAGVCTLLASAIPALRAGLMDPAEALHRE